MASALEKKPCTKCDKGSGVTTCDGCQQSFCIKHIIEHRQELAVELDNIGQEHDLFRRDLTQENVNHPLFIRIEEWEQESIAKIQIAAEVARTDLQQLLDETKNELKISVEKITNEMQSCRELDDYTESDLVRWMEELKQLRKLFETQQVIDMVKDEDITTEIQMIKIQQEKARNFPAILNELSPRNLVEEIDLETLAFTEERFRNFLGRINLSDNGLLATCLGTYWDGSNVYCTRLYSSGIHEIHFRVENKGSNNLYFGIKTTLHEMPLSTLTSSYTYGWSEVDQDIESVNGHRVHTDRMIRKGDKLTMTLNCDHRQIRLLHHRINIMTFLPIELEKCPFPWKILVTLRSAGDSVRILL